MSTEEKVSKKSKAAQTYSEAFKRQILKKNLINLYVSGLTLVFNSLLYIRTYYPTKCRSDKNRCSVGGTYFILINLTSVAPKFVMLNPTISLFLFL